MQVLSRRTKNNPVLLGEAGVGKTAIVEGLAQLIIDANVPELLRDKRLVVLDLAMMVAGTKYRGQFEERIKAVMNEVRSFEEPRSPPPPAGSFSFGIGLCPSRLRTSSRTSSSLRPKFMRT